MQWPDKVQSVVTLTFDFDAESVWLANNPRHHEMPGVLSKGTYGARVGVWKILELLREEELTATFFVPGMIAEQYPQHVNAIANAGHEIAHHGYTHTAPDPADPALVEREIEEGLDALHRVVGIRPVGYRAPDGMISDLALRLLTERGFVYDSSFKDDIVPYRHEHLDGTPGLVELPEQPTLDDWTYGAISPSSPGPFDPKDAVLSIWQDEFTEIHAWGGLFMLVMHPQVTGRPMRLATLRELISLTRGFDGVQYATCIQAAEDFIAQE